MTARKMNPATERMASQIAINLKLIIPQPIDDKDTVIRQAIFAGVNITIDAATKSQPIYLIDAMQIKTYLAKHINGYKYNEK